MTEIFPVQRVPLAERVVSLDGNPIPENPNRVNFRRRMRRYLNHRDAGTLDKYDERFGLKNPQEIKEYEEYLKTHPLIYSPGKKTDK